MGLEFTIGFLTVSIWDILDIGIVAYLLYQLYKLLRGSIAFNIFIGLLLMYVAWFVVKQLGMDLLSSILDQFVQVGIIILIVVFQPEVRRFLLLLGNTTLRQRSNFLGRILDRNALVDTDEKMREQVAAAVLRMSRQRTGALLVLAGDINLEGAASGGTALNATISQGLIESIFSKESPLHDGAVLVQNGRLARAGAILPVSESADLPKSVGLRHRAAVGITEKANVAALIVSEERGHISFALAGELERKITPERLEEVLQAYL